MNDREKIIIGNIQRFCLHDGDGIRTTVFLKGCNLRCPWCSNPENLTYSIQSYYDEGVKKDFGKLMSEDEIVDILLKDTAFYGCNGGVTYSGGEPLLSLSRIENVLMRLKEAGISQWVESALFASSDQLLFSLEYIDSFIVDLKNIVKVQCMEYLGGDTETFFRNFRELADRKRINVIRIPLINKYTYNDANIYSIISFLSDYTDIPVQVFKVKNWGETKYKKLSMNYNHITEITDIETDDFLNELRKIKINVSLLDV